MQLKKNIHQTLFNTGSVIADVADPWYSKPGYALMMTGIVILLFCVKVPAYDGDIDYLAPYMTVDPETGKRITVEPRAQAKTLHEGSADTTDQTASTTVEPPPEQTGSTMGQSAQDNASISTSGQSESSSVSSLPIIGGIIIALLAMTIAFYSKRKKPDSGSETDTSGS